MKKIVAGFVVFATILIGLFSSGVMAVSQAENEVLASHCDEVREKLKVIQKNDAKTRVFLGGKYETILNKYMVPLNVRLVENNVSTNGLIEIQNEFADAKITFNNDYIVYQQTLENLVGIDCKSEPDRFYNELSIVRKKRLVMEQDVMKMRNLITRYVKQVTELKGKI